MSRSEFQKTAGSAGVIGLTALGGAVIGFFLQLFVAYYFGASTQTDAFFMASSTSDLLSKLLLGGSITAVFIPLFVERLTREGKDSAWEMALNVFHLSASIFLIAVIILGFFTRPFVHFIAPGFDAQATTLTINLLRVLLPSFLFLFLVDISTAILYSFKQFSLPAWLRLIAPLVSLISLALLARSMGVYALAIGTVLGSIVQLLFLMFGLRRQGLHYRWVLRPLDPVITRLLHLVYPFILSVLVTQGAGIVYRVLVSGLPEGSLTALKFSEKITQLCTIIFVTSITTVIYPLLSEKASQRDYSGMRETIASAVRLICLITVPLIIGIVMLREPLIAFIYQRGSFNASDAHQTSLALLFLVLGLTINGISSVLGYTTLALQETRASVAVSITSQAVAIFLFVVLVPLLGHAGLALASSLVPFSIAGLYFLYLTRFIPNLGHIFWHRTFIKIAFLALVLFGVLYYTIPFFTGMTTHHQLALIIQLTMPSFLGSAVFFGGSWLLHIPEMHELGDILKQKIKRVL